MKFKYFVISIPLLVVAASSACAQNLAFINSFPGDSAIGPKTNPDNVGAVGPEHVVDFTCADFVVHDKKTGKALLKKTQTEFWKDAGIPDVLKPNDPRFLYDPLSGRYFATIAHDRVHKLYLAVSSSSDPTKPWKGVLLPCSSPDFGFRIGVDKNGFYGCYWNYNKDTHTMMDCIVIPKADLLVQEGPDMSNLKIFSGIEIESFPATDLDPNKSAEAPEILLNREFGNSFGKLNMYKVTWSGKAPSISKLQSIPLSRAYVSPNGSSLKNQATQPAPGGKLRADEGRRTCAVYAAGGSIFSCNEAKRDIDSRCGIFWCEVKASNGILLQEGFIDSPDCDYLAPSLAVDAKGNAGIGCTRSSSSEFPSACVMARKAGDPKNGMGKPVIAAKGTTVFTSKSAGKYGIPWGNYNSTCLDPVDPTIIWSYQEYAASFTPDQFSTFWTAFRVK